MEKAGPYDNIKELEDFIGLGGPGKDVPDGLSFLRRFKIISKIDKGAHGQVMLARDTDTDKVVAIKFMPRDQRHKSKFEKEINVFKALERYDPYPPGFPKLIYEGKTEYVHDTEK